MKYKKNIKRPKRADSFFGLHFDCHLTDACNQVGKDLMPQDIERLIKIARPDHIHCDCKGHPGISSYPTKHGSPAPRFIKDPLRLWREVTARHGVALYAHYCGLWSSDQIKRHPTWACVQADGKPSKLVNSVFGPYPQKVLIPQMRELVEEYDLDGVWIDGDCWAALPEYGKSVLQKFRAATGIKLIPRTPQDPHFFEFLEFCRDGYREYFKNYVDAVHRINPDFQICCNWAYSSFMPEKIDLNVDFLSGDHPPLDSVNHARWEARCMVHQDKPWDLVPWGIALSPEGTVSTKSPVQLMQQAAIPISLGGGVTFYFYQPKRDASLNRWEFDLIGDIAQFCKDRQKLCHKAESVPQVAMLHSSYDYYRQNDRLFAPRDPFVQGSKDMLSPSRGLLQCLLESQNVVDVLMEHHLEEKLHKYPLLIIPEIKHLCQDTKKTVLEYVANGGNLLIVGSGGCGYFQKELKVRFDGEVVKECRWLESNGILCAVKGAQKTRLLKGAASLGKLFASNDLDQKSISAASRARYGKGWIAGVYFDAGSVFSYAAAPTIREFMRGIVRKLFAEPIVSVHGSSNVDVTLGRKDGRMIVNLVNTAGPHAHLKTSVFDEIPPIGPLKITIRLGRRPRNVQVIPLEKNLNYSYAKGLLNITIAQVKIHSVIAIDE